MLDIPDGLGYGAKSPELREEPLRTKVEKALSPEPYQSSYFIPFHNNKVRL